MVSFPEGVYGGKDERDLALGDAVLGPAGAFDNRLERGAEASNISRSCDGIEKNP